MAFAMNNEKHTLGKSYSSPSLWTMPSESWSSTTVVHDDRQERLSALRKAIREQRILLSVYEDDADSKTLDDLKSRIRSVSRELKALGKTSDPLWTRYQVNLRVLQDLVDEARALKKEVDYLMDTSIAKTHADLIAETERLTNLEDKLQPDERVSPKAADRYRRITEEVEALRQDVNRVTQSDLPAIDEYVRTADKEIRDRQMFEKGLFVSPEIARFIDSLESDNDGIQPPFSSILEPKPQSAPILITPCDDTAASSHSRPPPPLPTSQRPASPRSEADIKAEAQRRIEERRLLFLKQKSQQRSMEDLRKLHKPETAGASRSEQLAQERLRRAEAEARQRLQNMQQQRIKMRQEAEEKRRQAEEEREAQRREEELKRKEEEARAAEERRQKEEEMRQRRARLAAEQAAKEKKLLQEEIERRQREMEERRLEEERRRREWLEEQEKRQKEREATKRQEEMEQQQQREEAERKRQEAEAEEKQAKEEQEERSYESETAGTSGYGVDIEDEVDFGTIYRVKTLYEYRGIREDDLSFGEDEILKAHPHKDSASDWWYGTSLTTNQVGFFPRTYVEIVEEAFRVRALYDFEKTREDDLAFVENEILVVQPFQDDTGDWWYGTNEDTGESGYFPKSYVEVINPATESLPQSSLLSPSSVSVAAHLEQTLSSGQNLGIPDDGHRGMSAPNTPVLKKESLHINRSESNRRRRAASNAAMLETNGIPVGRARALSTSSTGSGPMLVTWAATLDEKELAAIPTEERERQEAIFELISTEKSYLRDLQVIVNVFYTESSEYLTREEQDVIFANIDDLLLCNTALLSDLEAKQREGANVVSTVGDVFLKHADSLKCYSTYCRNQSFASRLLQEKRDKDKWFDVFLKTAQNRPECRSLDLSHFLLEPMQRITRYPLLLKKIFSATPKKHPDHGIMRSALAKAERILADVNEETRRYENVQKLRELSRIVDMESYGRLDTIGREFVMEGVLHKAKSGRKLHGYLFNDVLILAEPLRGLSTEGYLYRLYREPLNLERISIRQHHNMSLKPSFGGNTDDTGFQIIYGNQVIAVKAASVSQKRQWINQIQHYSALQSTMGHNHYSAT